MSPGWTICKWLRGVDLNHRPLGYEPNELPDCSTPQFDDSNRLVQRQTCCSMRAERKHPIDFPDNPTHVDPICISWLEWWVATEGGVEICRNDRMAGNPR